MRFLKYSLAILCLLIAGVAGLAWLMLDDKPLVEPVAKITREDMVWAKQLFQRNDPRARTPNTMQTLALSEEDVNRLLNYVVVLRPLSGMSVDLLPHSAQAQATLRLRPNPFGRYLNLRVSLEENGGALKLDSMRVGDLPIPTWLVDGATWLGMKTLERDQAFDALAKAVSQVRLDENQLELDYHWKPELATLLERRGASLVVSEEDRARLLNYADFITRQIHKHRVGSSIPMAELVRPVFEFAKMRGGDVAAENRAALIALGAYVSGISLKKLLTDTGRSTRRAPDVNLKLYNRDDWPQHYLIAAALSVSAGSRLANIIGLAKEEDDTQFGSGFSFTDLAADKAGAQLGALSQGPHAAMIQAMLASAFTDQAICPQVADLPEFMSEEQFSERYGHVGSTAYHKVIREIDHRIAQHPMLGLGK